MPEDSVVKRVVVKETKNEQTLPARIHRDGALVATSRLSLGIEPELHLSWAVAPRYFESGYRLLIFRNSSGFCPERFPDDLNRHGQLIVETKQSASYSERLPEGTYYYTVLLCKQGLLLRRVETIRFSETIPTAKIGIGRIKDRIELQTLAKQQELGELEHEAKLNETELRVIESRQRLTAAKESPKELPVHPLLAEELRAIDLILDGQAAKREKLKALKVSPKFLGLTRAERKRVVEEINRRLDPGELSAGQDVRYG
jgi:ribosomal protein L7/L12